MSAETFGNSTGAASSVHSSHGSWTELEAVVDELGRLARSDVPVKEFYRQVLACLVQAMAATGAAAWLRDPRGLVTLAAAVGEFSNLDGDDPAARASHEKLLARMLTEGGVRVVSGSPGSSGGQPNREALVESNTMILAAVPATVSTRHQESTSAAETDQSSRALAVFQVALAPGASPASIKGQECFLTAVAEIASDYHVHQELFQLRQAQRRHQQLLDLSHLAHLTRGLRPTAYVIANEGRRVVGCDRLSVLVPCGRRCRLLAVSGVKRVERRSFAARELERLAQLSRKLQEPIVHYDDDTYNETHTLPQVTEQVQRYIEESHARQLVVLPVQLHADNANHDRPDAAHAQRETRRDVPQALLIAEQFDGRSERLPADQVREVGSVCATAFHQAAEWDNLPLRELFVALGKVRDVFLPRHLPKTLLGALLAAAAVAALLFVDTDFMVEATGTMQPVVRRNVFASRSGLVDEVLVQHGDGVAAGQELVRLRDPELDLEWKKLTGDLKTSAGQLDAVQAAKTNRAAGGLTAIDTFRLSAEEGQLKQKLNNLREEIALLDAQREELILRSPLDGQVVTWDVVGALTARPVERGQVLLTVAEIDDRWQLELDVADNRLGYLLAAREKLPTELRVEYRLTAEPQRQFEGRVTEIAGLVDVAVSDTTNAFPKVRVHVALDEPRPGVGNEDELRPGMTARAQIHCGQRSLAYVWFHDVWDAVVRWATY